MKNAKRLTALLLALVMMLALAACSQPSTEQPADTKQDATQAETPAATAADAEVVGAGSPFEGETVDPRAFTLRLTINGSDDLVEAATQIWKTKYPNATVEKIDSAWGAGGTDARNKQLIMLSGGEQLDIGKVVWGKEFFEEGIIVDLTDKVESFDYWPYLTEGQKSRMSLDGKYYGATIFNNTVFLFYNKDILAQLGVSEPPATIAEMEAIGEKLAASGLKTEDGKDIYLVNFEGGNWATDYWLWALGGKQMNDDYTETLINSPESIAAYERMQSYIEKGWAPKLDGSGDQAWLNGQLAFYVTGDWVLNSTNEAGINAGYSIMPTGDTGVRTTSIGGCEFVVFSNSKYQDESIDWLRALTSDEFQKIVTRSVTNISFYDDPEMQAAWKEAGLYEGKMAQKAQLEYTTYNFLEAPYSYPDASSIYSTALQKILTGMQDVTEVMNDAAEQINAGIAKYHG